MRPLVAFALSILLLGACAEEQDPGDALDPGRFHFPTGVALTPEEAAIPQRLLVVSSNTDLRFRSGMLHAFDLATIDALVDAAATCDEPPCPIARIHDLDPALVGAVEVGDLAGEVATAALEGEGLPPIRAFVPVRGTGTVVAVDLDEDGARCAKEEGDCSEGGVIFPREDPYTVEVSLGNVFVGHGTLFRQRTGAVGILGADDPAWRTGRGSLIPIALGRTAVGGLAAGACRGSGDLETCTLFVNSRSSDESYQPVFAIDFRSGARLTSPLFSRNLASSLDGFNSRGIGVSASGEKVYTANRFPAALAVVDVTRMPDLPTDACVVPEGIELEPGVRCPDLPPSQGARPGFGTVNLSPAPNGPLSVTVIPRALPDGGSSDLVLMTTEESLAFFDGPTGALVANVDGFGGAPSALAYRSREEGVRIYATSFGRGVVAVIDVEDLFHPGEARIVATLGRPQEDRF